MDKIAGVFLAAFIIAVVIGLISMLVVPLLAALSLFLTKTKSPVVNESNAVDTAISCANWALFVSISIWTISFVLANSHFGTKDHGFDLNLMTSNDLVYEAVKLFCEIWISLYLASTARFRRNMLSDAPVVALIAAASVFAIEIISTMAKVGLIDFRVAFETVSELPLSLWIGVIDADGLISLYETVVREVEVYISDRRYNLFTLSPLLVPIFFAVAVIKFIIGKLFPKEEPDHTRALAFGSWPNAILIYVLIGLLLTILMPMLASYLLNDSLDRPTEKLGLFEELWDIIISGVGGLFGMFVLYPASFIVFVLCFMTMTARAFVSLDE